MFWIEKINEDFTLELENNDLFFYIVQSSYFQKVKAILSLKMTPKDIGIKNYEIVDRMIF